MLNHICMCIHMRIRIPIPHVWHIHIHIHSPMRIPMRIHTHTRSVCFWFDISPGRTVVFWTMGATSGIFKHCSTDIFQRFCQPRATQRPRIFRHFSVTSIFLLNLQALWSRRSSDLCQELETSQNMETSKELTLESLGSRQSRLSSQAWSWKLWGRALFLACNIFWKVAMSMPHRDHCAATKIAGQGNTSQVCCGIWKSRRLSYSRTDSFLKNSREARNVRLRPLKSHWTTGSKLTMVEERVSHQIRMLCCETS